MMNSTSIFDEPPRMSIINHLPGLLVMSTPLSGWQFFGFGNTFSFTLSYLICVLSVIIFIINKRNTGLNVQTSSNFFIVFFASPLLLSTIFSLFPLMANEHANLTQFILSNLHLIFWLSSIYTLLAITDLRSSILLYLRYYLLSAILVSSFGAVNYFITIKTGVPIPIYFNIIARESPAMNSFLTLPRLTSIFHESGWYAHYVIVSLIIILCWLRPSAVLKHKRSHVIALTFLSLFLGLTVLATLSASALLVGLALYFFTFLTRPGFFKKIIKTSVIVSIVAMIPSPGDLPNPSTVLIGRIQGILSGDPISGESIDSRSSEIAAAYDLFISSNALGIGYGQSTANVRDIRPVGTDGISSFYAVLLAETGFLGFGLFVGAILLIYTKIWTLEKQAKNNIRLKQILFTARCVFLAECLFLNFFSNLASSFYASSLWFIFAVIAIASRSLAINKNSFEERILENNNFI